MKVGYLRVSTLDQNPARQMELMKYIGVEKIFLERQREGIEIAKAEGKHKGRKPIEVTDKFFVIAKR